MGLIFKHSYPRGIRARVRRLEEAMDVTQEDLDNLATEVQGVKAKLDEGISNVQTEIDTLESEVQAGKPSNELDLDGLRQAVSDLGVDVESVGNLKPTPAPPASTAAQESAPTDSSGLAQDNTADPEVAAKQAAGE